MAMIVLEDGVARATIDPGLGAALTSYSVATPDGRFDLLRPLAAGCEAEVFAQSCNLMLPWCNRLSGGGFGHAGGFARLTANFPDQEFPLHGNALQEEWKVVASTAATAVVHLRSRGPGPFDYAAQAEYALVSGAMHINLKVRHLGQVKLPYGIGLHPWFNRTPGTIMQAKVTHAWLMDDRQLPRERIDIDAKPEWDFTKSRQLPTGFVDNPLSGWDGRAMIAWPEHRASLVMQASGSLAHFCHLFAPSSTAGFFCFEPTSHLPDAHNFAGYDDAGGLVELGQGEELSGGLVMEPVVDGAG